MNQVKVALVAAEGRGTAADHAGEPFEDVAVAVMAKARRHFMAPSEDEAFAGSVGALMEAFPDLPIMQEAKALGDRSKVVAAVLGGVPVDMEAAEAGLAPYPDPPVDLLGLWDRSSGAA